MDREEITEDVSIKDVNDICLWLSKTEGVAGANRVAEAIRNCYSEAEREFGPGRDKTYVAQVMLELSKAREKAAWKLLYVFAYFIFCGFIGFTVWQGLKDYPALNGYSGEFYCAVVSGAMAGGLTGIFLSMLLSAVNNLLWRDENHKTELLLIKYYARCAELEDENKKLEACIIRI